ncbi:hypothetical protein CM50_08765 [Bacillus subtilis]|nr:hypothetical protein CM50_08765 [Bacillus subtilis] [Bacillus stercoris]
MKQSRATSRGCFFVACEAFTAHAASFVMAEAEMAILKKQRSRLKRRKSGIPLLTSKRKEHIR